MAWVRGEQRDPDHPESGCYAVKLVKGGPEVAAKIWHDKRPEEGVDIWWATTDGGQSAETHSDPQLNETVQQIWLFGRKIDDLEYDFMLARAAHARQHEPNSPWANPRKPMDLRTIPPIGD